MKGKPSIKCLCAIPDVSIIEQDIFFWGSDGAECKTGYDSIRHTCAAESPEEIWVLGLRCGYEGAVCEDDIGADEEIERESVGVGGVALAAVEDVAAYSYTDSWNS